MNLKKLTDICEKHGLDEDAVKKEYADIILISGGHYFLPYERFLSEMPKRADKLKKRKRRIWQNNNTGLLKANRNRKEKQIRNLESEIRKLEEELDRETDELKKGLVKRKLNSARDKLIEAKDVLEKIEARIEELLGSE